MVMGFHNDGADDIVESGAEPPACNHGAFCFPGIEIELFSGACQFKGYIGRVYVFITFIDENVEKDTLPV